MDDQTILAVDDKGEFLEYIPKTVGHTGKGKRHLAITVLLINNRGEVLLQRRKHKVFDDIWDFTASTHPLHKANGIDETLEEATIRALKDEYGINYSRKDLKRVGVFNYFAQIGPYCENEHDFLLIGEYNGEVKLNSRIAYEYKWVSKLDLLKDMKFHSQKYSPWSQAGLKVLKKEGFFG
ncbi:NUDIX domain-containing protein [Candidatus Daviesbacteria bacterium]|nr:NUDIX domain-containing protein [Candidatus Daviesbacteria bacterium]